MVNGMVPSYIVPAHYHHLLLIYSFNNIHCIFIHAMLSLLDNGVVQKTGNNFVVISRKYFLTISIQQCVKKLDLGSLRDVS